MLRSLCHLQLPQVSIQLFAPRSKHVRDSNRLQAPSEPCVPIVLSATTSGWSPFYSNLSTWNVAIHCHSTNHYISGSVSNCFLLSYFTMSIYSFLESIGVYGEGKFSFSYGYLYLLVINNLTQMVRICMYNLIQDFKSIFFFIRLLCIVWSSFTLNTNVNLRL